jgi:sigma-B regulation protein RsbU (phosphoserine phosphatase)
MPAALLMSNALAVQRAHIRKETEPVLEEVAAAVNRSLYQQNRTEQATWQYLTGIFGIFDVERMTFEYVNAGHPHPVIVHAAGAIENETEPDFMAGLLPDSTFTKHTIQLQPGSAVILYSDGFVDATDSAGDRFGEEQALELMNGLGGKTAEGVCCAIRERISSFQEGLEQADDLTVVTMWVPRGE